MMTVTELLERQEGRRLKVYVCPAGKQTIGIGRNIEDRGISESEASLLLENDIAECTQDLIEIFTDLTFVDFTDARQAGLISMRFQLGYGGFRKFVRMIAAIRMRQWSRAADEALDSNWSNQTPKRAAEVAAMLRSGEWPE